MSCQTRSGVEFSPFTLGTPVQTTVDLEELLQARFTALYMQGDCDGLEDELEDELEKLEVVSLYNLLPAWCSPSIRTEQLLLPHPC